MRNPGTGLLGNTLHTDDAEWSRKDSGIGAGIDSFYEYLLKVAYLHCPDCKRQPASPVYITTSTADICTSISIHLTVHHSSASLLLEIILS